MATITAFWSRKRNEPYHIGKNGVMGEMEGGLKILLRYSTYVLLYSAWSSRWRCSLWKLVWKELTVYLLCYVAISLVYRYHHTTHPTSHTEEFVQLNKTWHILTFNHCPHSLLEQDSFLALPFPSLVVVCCWWWCL